MAATPPRKVTLKAHERHAWVLLLLAGFPMFVGSVAHLVSGEPLAAGLQFANTNLGMTWEQLVAERPAVAASITGFIRVMAIFGMALFLLFTAVVATGYRRGERWAWLVAWTYPMAILGFASIATIHNGWSDGELDWAGPGIAIQMILILLGLLLPLRKFFPRMDR